MEIGLTKVWVAMCACVGQSAVGVAHFVPDEGLESGVGSVFGVGGGRWIISVLNISKFVKESPLHFWTCSIQHRGVSDARLRFSLQYSDTGTVLQIIKIVSDQSITLHPGCFDLSLIDTHRRLSKTGTLVRS
jgi:hypothetical protein